MNKLPEREMNKTEMAQVIVQALRNYDELPAAANPWVRAMVNQRKKSNLAQFYPKALEIIAKREASA